MIWLQNYSIILQPSQYVFMKVFYDLHVHSYWSDGDYSPSVVVELAKKNGLSGLVLTDHDTFLGWPEFAKAASENRFEIIQGIEISSTIYNANTHVLGYSRYFQEKILLPLLEKARANAFERMRKIAEKLRENNLANINVKFLQEEKGDKAALTKYDLQKELVARHGLTLAESIKLMRHGGLAYVPYDKQRVPHPKEVVELIHRANGLAVLAHPGEMIRRFFEQGGSQKVAVRIIPEVIGYGLDGLEVYSLQHDSNQEREFSAIADRFSLVKTGGSDFHGAIHAPGRILGSSGIDEKLWQEFLKKLPG